MVSREFMDFRHQKQQRERVRRRAQLFKPVQRSELVEVLAEHDTLAIAVPFSPSGVLIVTSSVLALEANGPASQRLHLFIP